MSGNSARLLLASFALLASACAVPVRTDVATAPRRAEPHGTTQVFIFEPSGFIAVGSDNYLQRYDHSTRTLKAYEMRTKTLTFAAVESTSSGRRFVPPADASVAILVFRDLTRILLEGQVREADIQCFLHGFVGTWDEKKCGTPPPACWSQVRPIASDQTLAANADRLAQGIESCWSDAASTDHEIKLEFLYLGKNDALPWRYTRTINPTAISPSDPNRIDGEALVTTAGMDYNLRRLLDGIDPWLGFSHEDRSVDRFGRQIETLRVCARKLKKWEKEGNRPNDDRAGAWQQAGCFDLFGVHDGVDREQVIELRDLAQTIELVRSKFQNTLPRDSREALRALSLTAGHRALDLERAACLAHDLVQLQLVVAEHFRGSPVLRLLDRDESAGLDNLDRVFGQRPVEVKLLTADGDEKKPAFEYVEGACRWDADGDGIYRDGDGSGTPGDNPCSSQQRNECDDNCPDVYNLLQEDGDGDGVGDACEAEAPGGP